MDSEDKKPVIGCDGTCGIHDCPHFRSDVEPGWGIAWKCMKGGINAVKGFPSSIPSRCVVCPHDPMAMILNQISKLSYEEQLDLRDRLEELMEVGSGG